MKLLLTSSGITNKSIEKSFKDLLGKPSTESTIVYVPTAANVEEGDKGWVVDDMNNFRKLGLKLFDIVDISAAPKEVWLPRFEKADALVFGGGNEKYLLEWMRKIGLDKELTKLLENKVYVGISAGSMVTSKNITLNISGILYYEEFGNLPNIDGLGFVDFEIRPHLNSTYFPKVNLAYLEEIAPNANNTFYAIDDNTAVQVIDGKASVVSEGTWKKFEKSPSKT